jgi:hypothetical protein
MAKQKLPTDWRERPLDKWNSATFRLYLYDMHQERFSIPYVARSIKTEAAMCKRMIDEYGAESVKSFIDECFREYKPTPQYPSINFAFMYSFMRDRIMPKVLAENARKERMTLTHQPVMTEEEITNWL